MKTQVVSILLSALLCSTLAHDYLRSHHHAKHLNHHGKHHLANRANDQCQVQCTNPNITGDLQLYWNATVQLGAIVNTTARVALVIDVQASIVLLLNGATGAAVAIDIAAGSGVLINSGVWVAANVSFDLYFRALSSLKAILTASGAVSFSVASAGSAVLQVALVIVQGLVGRLQVQVADSLTIAVAVSKSLVASLQVIGGLLASGAVQVRGSILVIVNILSGVQTLVTAVSGGVAALVAAHVILDLAIILSGVSAIQVLASILVDISSKLSLSIVQIASSDQLLIILGLLGGSVIDGSANGVLNLLASIVLLAQGSIKINKFINIVIGVALELNGSINLNDDLQLLLEFSGVANLATYAQALIAGSLQIRGVIVANILAALQAGASNVLGVVVKVLVAISVIVAVQTSLPLLVLHFYGLLTTRVGLAIAARVIPSLSAGISITKTIIDALNTLTLIQLLLNFSSGIQSIPVVGAIYVAISAAVSASGSLSLSSLISGSSTFIASIRDFFTVLIRGSSGVSSSVAQSANLGALEVSAGASFSFSSTLTLPAAPSS